MKRGISQTIWDMLNKQKQPEPPTNGKPAPAQSPIKKELPGAGIIEGPVAATNGGKKEISRTPVANVLDELIREHREVKPKETPNAILKFEIGELKTPFGNVQLKKETRSASQILTIIVDTTQLPLEAVALLEKTPYFPYLDGETVADVYVVNMKTRSIHKTIVENPAGKTEKQSDAYFIPIIPVRHRETQELRNSLSYFELSEEQKMELDDILECAGRATGKRYKVPGE
ncbi:MAG: hypothetical protein V1492_03135 [Candidatus Micrarchaeota archaeon]